MLLIKKTEQRITESSTLNNFNYRSSHEFLLCNLHFIKHFVHFCPSDKVSIETEKLLKGKPVWVDSFILKYSKYKCIVSKFFQDYILTSTKSPNSCL